MVWTSVEWDAVGWCWLGLWRGWGGGVDSEEGEGCEGESEERRGEEGVVRFFRFNIIRDLDIH